MDTKTTEKPLILRLFKTKEPKEPPKATDIEKVVKEQHPSTTQIRKLANDVQSNQHKAAVGTHDLLSQLKHLKNMEKKRQKMTNEYIRSQRTDPTLSPLIMVQRVVQEMDEIPPYPIDNPQPTAPFYPDLHSVHHTTSLPYDPLHVRNIDHTLQELQIPGFSPDQPLQHNQQKLEIEIEQTQKNHHFFQGMAIKQSDLIKLHQKCLRLLRDLKNKLPHFCARTSEPTPFFPYSSGDRTPILSSINDTLQTSWSTSQHSEAISQPPFSAEVPSNPPETKATKWYEILKRLRTSGFNAKTLVNDVVENWYLINVSRACLSTNLTLRDWNCCWRLGGFTWTWTA